MNILRLKWRAKMMYSNRGLFQGRHTLSLLADLVMVQSLVFTNNFCHKVPSQYLVDVMAYAFPDIFQAGIVLLLTTILNSFWFPF